MKRLSILGSTGSIGRNVLEVVARFPERFQVAGLSAGKNIGLLIEQIERFRPRLVSVRDERLAVELKARIPAGLGVEVASGINGCRGVATLPEVDMVVSAMVGAAGLVPTYEAICAGKNIALANKEVLVTAGSLIMKAARDKGVSINPVDSEHGAIFQSLLGHRKEDVRRIILTASGGPFLHYSYEMLHNITPAEALKHPNWQMGRKITIDSASLMNKGLEVIEAKWLFDLSVEQIAVQIHPQSIVHSMVEYIDGSIIAQLGIPDMRIPIAYALSAPERIDMGLPRLDLPSVNNLTFLEPDMDKFPCLRLAYAACKQGGTLPVVLNAANEVAVDAFLEGGIRFTDIARIVEGTMYGSKASVVNSLEDVMAADHLARIRAEEEVKTIHRREHRL